MLEVCTGETASISVDGGTVPENCTSETANISVDGSTMPENCTDERGLGGAMVCRGRKEDRGRFCVTL